MGDYPEVPFETPVCARRHDAQEMVLTKYRYGDADDRIYRCTTCGREMQVRRDERSKVVYRDLGIR